MNAVYTMDGNKVAKFSGVVSNDEFSPAMVSLYPAGIDSASGVYRNAAGDEVLIETLTFVAIQNNGGSDILYADGVTVGTIPTGQANVFRRTIEGCDDSGNWPYLLTTAGTASYTAIVYGT